MDPQVSVSSPTPSYRGTPDPAAVALNHPEGIRVQEARLHATRAAELLAAIELRQIELGLAVEPNVVYSGEHLLGILTSKAYYEQILMHARVFEDKGLKKDPAGNEIPQIVPGPLLKGMNDDPVTWLPGMRALDLTLRHLRSEFWALPKSTLHELQAIIRGRAFEAAGLA